MTDFMWALPVILVQLSWPADQRAFQLHNTQVWLCVLVLSFSSISTFAVSPDDMARLQTCFRLLRHTIEKSDAMLYAPAIADTEENCKNVLLKCYMLELIMVLDEEEVQGSPVSCILALNDRLDSGSVGCRPCESHSLQNITIFLDRLNTFLEKMTAMGNM